MAFSGFYRGSSTEQDPRYKDKIKQMIKAKSWPVEFNYRIDMNHVKLSLIKPWVENKVNEMLQIEDDILVNYVMSILEDTHKVLDPKEMQIYITPFLEENTDRFMLELWKLLITAMQDPNGVPKGYVDERKREIKKEIEQIDAHARRMPTNKVVQIAQPTEVKDRRVNRNRSTSRSHSRSPRRRDYRNRSPPRRYRSSRDHRSPSSSSSSSYTSRSSSYTSSHSKSSASSYYEHA